MTWDKTERDATAELAAQTAIAVNRLNARLREEAGAAERGLTLSQIAMLQRLADYGPLSVSSLAAMEHVTQQAITQRLALLAPTGYVSVASDQADRRSKKVAITAAGHVLLEAHEALGEQWLCTAISQTLDDEEKAALRVAAVVMERLSRNDCESGESRA
jgi:DNA-binding MarR family transcriptional regulator